MKLTPKWNEKNVRKNLWLFYLHAFFGNLEFSRGLFVIFLLSKGKTTTEVGILQTALFWSNLLAEIPAGILADKTRRKFSVAAGLLIAVLASVLMYQGQSFWVLLLAFIFYGVGFAFRSGADGALLYDGLKEVGPEWQDSYLRFSARSKGIVNISLGLAIASGGFLLGWGWGAVYAAVAASMVLSAIFMFAVPESSHASRAGEEVAVPLFVRLKDFFSDRTGRSLLGFLFGMGFLEATHAPFFIYFQVLFKQYGLPEWMMGLVLASSMGVTAVAYLWADKLAAFGFQRLLIGGSLLTAGLIFSLFFNPSVVAVVVLYALIDMLPSLLFVHTDNYIQGRVPSEIRASLLSVQSFVSSIFISAAFLGGGILLDQFPAVHVLASLGILPICGAIALSFYFAREKSGVACPQIN